VLSNIYKPSQKQNTTPNFIRLPIWISCILLAFDFKGQESGGIYQIVAFLTVCCLLGISALVLSNHTKLYPSRRLQQGFIFLIIFLLSTVFTATIQRVEAAHYLTVISPYILMFLAYWLTSGICRRYGALNAIRIIFPALIVTSAISTIWTLYYGSSSAGASLESVRYRIISVLIPFSFAYLASATSSQQLGTLDKFFAAIVLATLLISQTRSYILTLIIAVIFSTYGHANNTGAWIRKLIRITVFSLLALILSLVAVQIFETFIPSSDNRSLIEMWASRIFGSTEQFGFDLTTATRLAEYSDQMTKLLSSPINLLLGNGLGSSYTYSGTYANLVAGVLGNDAIPEAYWNGGHSLWVYTIYSSGILFGTAFVIFLIYVAWRAFKTIKYSRQINQRLEKHLLVTVSTGYLCMLSTGFAAFPLGSRPAAFLMGILIALVLATGTKNFRKQINNRSRIQP